MSHWQVGGGGKGCGRGPSNRQHPQRGRSGYQQDQGFNPQQSQQGGRGGGYSQQSRGSFLQQPQQKGRGGGFQRGQHDVYQRHGGMPTQQQFAPGPNFQGSGGHDMRNGMPPQQHRSGPSRTPVSDLHQGTQPSYLATPSQASSSSHTPEISQVAEQLQQMSVQGEAGETSQPAIPASTNSKRYPLRPGKGTIGCKCTVKANHFFAELTNKDFCHYYVAMEPDVTSRGVCRAVMEQLVRLYRESHLGGRLPAYDGRKCLYTAGELPFTKQKFRITLVDKEDGPNGQDDPNAQRRERVFTVTIRYVVPAYLDQLEQFLTGREFDVPQVALQVLDIVLRQWPTTKYSPVAQSFYSPELGTK